MRSGDPFEDPFDVLDETHVEHLVSFIQHDHGDAGQSQRLAPQMVHHSTGCADDDVDRVAQGSELAIDRLPAIDRQNGRSARSAELMKGLRHLNRKLAGWGQHQRLRIARFARQPLQEWQRKSRGLSGAGLRLRDQIAAIKQQRYCLALHRRRLLESGVVNRLYQISGEPQIAEIVKNQLRLPMFEHDCYARPMRATRSYSRMQFATLTANLPGKPVKHVDGVATKRIDLRSEGGQQWRSRGGYLNELNESGDVDGARNPQWWRNRPDRLESD